MKILPDKYKIPIPGVSLAFSLLFLLTTACHDIEDYQDNPRGNFDALWSIIDEHYCFLDEKGLDWNLVYNQYVPRISDKISHESIGQWWYNNRLRLWLWFWGIVSNNSSTPLGDCN